jgi:2-oxoglutarate ferredoxin oxidoreductase subunit alpha
MRRTATPSTCCCCRRTRTNASSIRGAALDLADRLQTPVFVMTDLDIGMNQRLCEPFAWDDSARYDRGKVMTAESWRPARTSAATRTWTATASPGARCRARTPARAATSPAAPRATRMRVLGARPDYIYNVERLLKKFATAATLVPQPVLRRAQQDALGVIYFGSTSPAMDEALDALAGAGIHWTRCGCAPSRSPIGGRVHRRARRGVRGRAEPRRQMRSLLINELDVDPAQAGARCCTTTARRSPRASSPRPSREHVHALSTRASQETTP